MRKKLICITLFITMLMPSISAFADVNIERVSPEDVVRGKTEILPTGYYWPEAQNFTVDSADCFEQNNSTVTDNGVEISAGGSATWGFYVPFNMRGVTINHEGAANITLQSGDNVYNMKLSGTNDGVANRLEFGVNLGRGDGQVYSTRNRTKFRYTKEFVEHRGEKKITITADSPITITSLVFEQEIAAVPVKPYTDITTLSNFESDTLSSVFINENAPVIIVSGGKRYVDYNDVSQKPLNYNGRLYLPINTLAKALGYYCEDMPDKCYALMRSEKHEVVMLNGECKVSKGLSDQDNVDASAIIYRGGKTWAAVRYFAELDGKTVGYRDGTVIIDNKYTVNDILNSSDLYDQVDAYFEDYKVPAIHGKTYHVASAPIGSDDNDGGVLSPFATITKAANVAQAGDTVIIHGGTYRETLKPKNSGTPTAFITFKAAEGENVTISAADSLGKPYLIDPEKNIYMVNMPMDMGVGKNQIFINGEMQTEARYPNGPELLDGRLSDAWGVESDIYKAEDDDTFCSDTLLNQEDDYWIGGTIVANFGTSFGGNAATIIDSTKGSVTVGEPWSWPLWWPQDVNANKRSGGAYWNHAWITGHKNAMDIPGEWIRNDDDTLNIILDESMNPDEIEIEAKARQLVIDLTDKEYINIEGINTIGGSVLMKHSNSCMLNGLDMKYITHYTIGADYHGGYIDFPYILKAGVEGAPHRGELGIFDNGTCNTIVNSHIDHSAGAALYLTGTYTYVENNVINDCGYVSSYVSGITMSTEPTIPLTSKRGGYAVYNNTVYNSSRSNLNLMGVNGASGKQACFNMATYLPMEVAWNDFHDSCIRSTDGANIYSYHMNGAVFGKTTQIHHNYVYQTTNIDDTAILTSGIYWDANTAGYDTHNNLVFTTGGGVYRSFPMFIAPEPWAGFVGAKVYNNQELGPIGDDINALQEGFFTESKEFYAGALTDVVYLNNYDKFSAGKQNLEYRALAAEVSNGVTVSEEDGYASFSGDGQYIHFSDVDFGDGKNEIAIHFCGDSNWTYDELEITIGDSIDSPRKHTITTRVDTYDLDESQTRRIAIGDTIGKNDVWIKVSKYYSIRIGGISVYKRTHRTHDNNITNLTYFSTYNSATEAETETHNPEDWLTKAYLHGYTENIPMLCSTWDGTTLTYEDRVIDKPSDYLLIYGSSFGKWCNQPMNIYLKEIDSQNPIASTHILDNKYFSPKEQLVKLNQTIPAGTYDIVVEFASVANTNLTSNLRAFAFLAEGADTSEYITSRVQWGGSYNEETSLSGDDARPLAKIRKDHPAAGDHYSLRNTYAGSVAVYDTVYIDKDSNELIVSYTAEPGYDGQEVEVRVDSLDSQPVAVFTTEATSDKVGFSAFSFVEHKIALPDNFSVETGEHIVYLSFGGVKGSDKTFQLKWFCFNENQTR